MNQYRVWVRINQTQTAHVVLSASYDSEVRALAESMYGPGSVLNYTRI